MNVEAVVEFRRQLDEFGKQHPECLDVIERLSAAHCEEIDALKVERANLTEDKRKLQQMVARREDDVRRLLALWKNEDGRRQ